MLVMTKKTTNSSDSIDYQILDQNEFSECFHAHSSSIFCHVRVCYRLMTVVVKAIHTASKHNLYRFGIMTNTQAIDVVTFDF